ncbi:MAG: recombinase family protein [Eubacteriales bacterium]|nr:recombinase family protein [Eubacteriales bacterium]
MITLQPSNAILRVAPYARVSTDEDDQLNSLENQVSYYDDLFAGNNSWIMVDMYIDEGITGTNTKKRKQFNRLIEDAHAGKIDLIITKEVSRFARNTVDTLHYTRALKAIGIGVIFLNDNIDTRDDDGEFRLTIMASVAQEESRKTSSRVKWGMKRKMERGYVMANTIFGFDRTKGRDGGAITINEDEAEIVRLIFYKFVYEGKSCMAIAKDLILEGVPVASTKRMKRWSATAVGRILKNEKYAGDLLQKKTYTPDFLDHKSVKNDGQEEKVFIPDHHENIISRELWDLAQSELGQRKMIIDNKSKFSNAYWASGKIFCSECGSSCIVRTKNLKDGSKYKAWRCKEVAIFGKEIAGCTNGQINDKALQSCVQYIIQLMDIQDDLVQELHEEIRRTQEENISHDTKKYEAELVGLMSKKERIIDLLLEGTISKEEMGSMKRKYDTEILYIQNKIKSAKEKKRNIIELNKNLTGLYGKIKHILSQKNPTPELYSQIIEKIIMYPTQDLDIYIKYIPDAISIHYETKGRGKNYETLCTLKNQEQKQEKQTV